MIPRKEFPNPQFERESWRNLNGEWDFAIDMARTGKERQMNLFSSTAFDKKIIVPFCPESVLSGIGNTDFMYGVWYRRKINLSAEEISGRVILNIGACDHKTEVFVNEKSVGVHVGGYCSFSFDITEYVIEGENAIVIYAEDEIRGGKQPAGKQSTRLESHGCSYTRTTGIWQTVWLEFVPDSYIHKFKINTDVKSESVNISGSVKGNGKLSAKVFYEGKSMGEASTDTIGAFSLNIKLSELHLWDIGCGNLYDLVLTLTDENGKEDIVKSYFGMREIGFMGGKFMLNGRSVYQRLVLDQGFYPDGIYTAPDDEALVRDIEISFAAGFNGARLHEKVFEPRFLYHADRLGYLVWGEHPDWGFNYNTDENLHIYLSMWLEELERDVNHPSIIGWCPFNETWIRNTSSAHNNNLEMIYKVTKAFDPSRPCIDTSGYTHTAFTDIFDFHDYSHNCDLLRKRYCSEPDFNNQELFGAEYDMFKPGSAGYRGQPLFVSECGGIGLKVTDNGWGYNVVQNDAKSVVELYCKVMTVFLESPHLFGFCYTQLYDVEQEQNGIYTYDRKPKMDIEKIRKCNMQKAAIED